MHTEDGLIAVEVKSKNDTVSKTQRDTFNLLEASGVKVYLWYDAEGCRGKLVHWEQGLALVKLGLA